MQRKLVHRIRCLVSGEDNPLRRYIDRLESAVATGLVIAFVVAAPLLAVISVRATAAATQREQHAESMWRLVPATLTQSASSGLIGLDGEWDASWVTAHWTAPEHHVAINGMLPVDLNAKTGQPVMIWVTQKGDLTHAPLTNAEAMDREVVVAVSVVGALALLCWTASRVVRALANRRRMISWTKAWEAVGPRWSTFR